MRVLFLFCSDHGHEWVKFKNGSVPSHRLWGAVELERMGHAVSFCPPSPAFFCRFGAWGWRFWQTLWVLWIGREIDAVVAVHEISALLVLGFKALGLCRVPVLVIQMGLLHPSQSGGWRRRVWRRLLRAAEVVLSLASVQMERLAEVFRLPQSRQSFVPMPVDAVFFRDSAASGSLGPEGLTGMLGKSGRERRFCLAVGTNDGKDFGTLVDALPLGERLVVVTDRFNALKIRSHPLFGSGIEVLEAVPMVELRKLYGSARVVVIPLCETPHGSGHTVFVECQALGKLTIVSSVSNMRDYVRDGENAIRVEAGDVAGLRRMLEAALNHPERFEKVRERAVREVAIRFGALNFAGELERLLKSIGRVREGAACGFQRMGGKKNDACVSGVEA